MSKSGPSGRVRRAVRERAQGRCEYCLVPERDSLVRHQLDHILARKHEGTSGTANLAYCCAICNKRKGADLGSVDDVEGVLIRCSIRAAISGPRTSAWPACESSRSPTSAG